MDYFKESSNSGVETPLHELKYNLVFKEFSKYDK